MIVHSNGYLFHSALIVYELRLSCFRCVTGDKVLQQLLSPDQMETYSPQIFSTGNCTNKTGCLFDIFIPRFDTATIHLLRKIAKSYELYDEKLPNARQTRMGLEALTPETEKAQVRFFLLTCR